MDDIGSFLYILIILASVIFSAINKSKKKSSKPVDDGSQIPDPMKEFRRLFENKTEEDVVSENDYLPQQEEYYFDREPVSDPFVPVEEVKSTIPELQPEEAVPQTVDKSLFYSNEAYEQNIQFEDDNEESVFESEISDIIKEGGNYELPSTEETFSDFDAKSAVIYDAILNRPYA